MIVVLRLSRIAVRRGPSVVEDRLIGNAFWLRCAINKAGADLAIRSGLSEFKKTISSMLNRHLYQ